jgi:asparagine synthase (glutamine-hydrolysing)
MCGIIGSVNKSFGNEILDLIHHRGPDDRGLEKLFIDNDIICFGHTRLSIQDLSKAGHQPMYSYGKNYLIVFNGEIYNHLELRKRLTNISWKGHSDTETIVNYIEKFGIKAIKDFNGIFSLGIFDIKKKKFTLLEIDMVLNHYIIIMIEIHLYLAQK